MNAILEFNYIETLKMIADELNKFVILLKYKYFVIIFGLAEKNRVLVWNKQINSIITPASDQNKIVKI